jgi:hypothetical protein
MSIDVMQGKRGGRMSAAGMLGERRQDEHRQHCGERRQNEHIWYGRREEAGLAQMLCWERGGRMGTDSM